MSGWLTQRCYIALLPNAQLSPDLGPEQQSAALEGSAWNSLCSASCWPGSFWSTVDREADSTQREVTGATTPHDESSHCLMQWKCWKVWWISLFLPPETNSFSCIWQMYTQHMAALVSTPFNLRSTPPTHTPHSHLLQNQQISCLFMIASWQTHQDFCSHWNCTSVHTTQGIMLREI